ncbi:MAG TPA: ABC transporter permease subunit [Amycolatopsis sp.]|nr:ABC transporter permease subunit [Amycolatopsis sp.]
MLLALVILGAWQWLGSSSEVQALTVSTPVDVLKWIGEWMAGEEGHGWDDLAVTMQEAALGWVLGVVVGVVLAVILASSKWLQLFGAPFVSILNALPKIALAPLFILIFGASLESKVYFVAAGIFFITFYNVFGGIRSIDPLLVRNARVLGASRLWLAREVYTPAIVGWLMTSLRLTSAWALTAAVVAEYLGAVEGMGYVVGAGQQNSQVEQVLGGVLVVAVVALVIDRILVLIEGHFARWRKS